jgi:hypothetical protein
VEVTAWCGRCGQQFRLAEVLVPPRAGDCPRCGEPFAAGYVGVVGSAVAAFERAADALLAAGTQLREMAPRLHIDAAGLAEQVRSALDH